jgi:AsmA protein
VALALAPETPYFRNRSKPVDHAAQDFIMTARRILLGLLIVAIILPILVVTVFAATFDPNRYAPELAAAVEEATGRQLTLGGPIKMSLSLTPKLSVDDVSLGNPPGFGDGNLLTISRVEARISLLPLVFHRLDIVKLVLTQPAITLETSDAGRADWDFTPLQGSAEAGPATAGSPGINYRVALESVEVRNGSIVIRRAKPLQSATITLTSLTGTAASVSAPLQLTAQAAFNGVPMTVNGVVGPVERFSGVGAGPWPVNLIMTTSGAMAAIQGGVLEPRTFDGYDFSVRMTISALEDVPNLLLAWFGSHANLPPIHGLTASAEVRDQNAAMPAINNLVIKAARSDLSDWRAGLVLSGLDIEMASLDSPVQADLSGAIGGIPLSIAGKFGSISQVINPAWLPADAPPAAQNFPVSLQAQAGGDKLGIEGGIAMPASLSGAALNVSLSIADLSALGGLAGTALPAWKNIIAQGTLIDPGGLGLTKTVGVDSLVLNMDNAALGGDASWYFGLHPRLQMALQVRQIDLDAVLAAMPERPSPAQAPPQAASSGRQDYVIPEGKLPLDMLKSSSADVQIAANTVILNHASYKALQGHAVLSNGILTVNPLTALLPGGSVSANTVLNATNDPAKATVSISAPALALSPLLNALNLPDTAEGTMQAGLSASGTGDSLHDLLGSVNGQLGLAMVNGTVDGQVLSRLFGAILAAVDLPARLVGAQGPVAVRCFGLRMDANNGIGQISALTLDSSRLLIQGGGSVNFGDETLGVIIRPQVRVAGDAIGVPVQIGGTFADPTTSVAPLAAVAGAAKSAVGLTVSLAEAVPVGGSLLGGIVNRLGIGTTPPDVCPAALALARLGNPGPATAPETAANSADATTPAPSGGPKNLLNALFGK